MTRSVLLSMSISSMLAVLASACVDASEDRDPNDYLRPVRIADDGEDREDDAPPKSKPATSSSAPAKATTPPSGTTSTTTAPATCDPLSATTKAECQRCCAAAPPAPAPAPAPKPATSCACGGGSKCGALCESSACRGEAPNIACGVCLLVAKCDPSEATAPSPSPSSSPAEVCQNVCKQIPE